MLLLDEATSALDVQSEAEVIQAIRTAGGGRTTIFITHRLHSVIDADIIFVLENGAVVEKGTHGELTKSRGKYYQYAQIQSI